MVWSLTSDKTKEPIQHKSQRRTYFPPISLSLGRGWSKGSPHVPHSPVDYRLKKCKHDHWRNPPTPSWSCLTIVVLLFAKAAAVELVVVHILWRFKSVPWEFELGLNFDYILHYAQMYKWSAIEWATELQLIQLYISTNTYTAANALNTPGRVTSTFQLILLIQQIMQAVRTCKAKSSPPHGAPARGVSQPPMASSFL